MFVAQFDNNNNILCLEDCLKYMYLYIHFTFNICF
jgi:hypothetical protein